MRTERQRGNYGVKLVRGPFLRLPPHEQACRTEAELLELVPKLERPLAADLFCGAGGLSLGLSRAGFDVVLGVDNDQEALETHRSLHPGLSVDWDLGDDGAVERVAHLVRKTGVTLVAGGPPCQPFSRAGRSMMRELVRLGRREAHDRRRDLWESFLGVVELSTPRAVVMENVPDMALDRGMVILRTMVERLEALGYSVEERVVDTWRYGVPQFRQRLILVALADGLEFTWPDEQVTRVSVENAIGDLPEVDGGWRPDNGDGEDPVASGWAAYAGPRSTFQQRARAGVPADEADRIYDHITRPVREDDAAAFAQMSHETRYSDLDPELKRYRDDIFDDKYKRLNPHDLSRTITAHIAKDGYWYIHPYQDRTLTVREAARLQTFPDEVRFAGPPSAAFRQIGNAVPVLLGERVGGAVLESLSAKRPAALTTSQVADRLADWMSAGPAVMVPWLRAETRWQVIQAEILWSRIANDNLGRAWSAVSSLRTPSEALAALPVLRRLAAAWNREPRCELLRECAEWFVENPSVLEPSQTAADLSAAPHVSPAVADLACRIVPGDSEDPILTIYGILRVAARFLGGRVDRQNRLTDGRLAIARMVGGADNSHEAHLALIEIANRICLPSAPDCGHCPLQEWCVEATVADVQQVLPLTTPDRRPDPVPEPAAGP